MNTRIEFILLFSLIIMLLFVPHFKDSVLEFFDFAFINLISILVIFYVFQYKPIYALLLTMIYMFCIMQRRKNIANIIIDEELNNLNICKNKKISAVMSVMKNKNIDNETKEKLVLQVIGMKIPKIQKYEIISLHSANKGNMEKVFETIYNEKSIPHLAFTKTLFQPQYKQIIKHNVNKSNIPNEIKTEIYNFINEKNNKKVSFVL